MSTFIGFVLTLIGGVSVGFSLWPLKWARRWKWENFWLFYSVFSMVLIPFALAFAMLPHLREVYSSIATRELALPFLLGFLWGFAQLGAGISVHRLGLAIAGAILNSIGAAFGTLLPLVFQHQHEILNSSGELILGGIFTMFLGAWLCARSGILREEEAKKSGRGGGFETNQAAMRQISYSKRVYFFSLGIAVISGILASLLNVALAYGGGIMSLAVDRGGSSSMAPFAVWPIALLGGSVVNIGYAVYLLSRNRNWSLFKGGSAEIFFPLIAALLWMGGIALYSSGTTYLGMLGISIGFAVFMITMVLSGQLAGVFTGEWKLMPTYIYRIFIPGIGLLILAILMIGGSHYFSG